jgi:hypothetical protein
LPAILWKLMTSLSIDMIKWSKLEKYNMRLIFVTVFWTMWEQKSGYHHCQLFWGRTQ